MVAQRSRVVAQRSRLQRERARLLPPPADVCPIRDVLDHVGGRWPVLAMFVLADGPCRFGQLRRGLAGVSQRMLAQTLRALQRDGLLVRRSIGKSGLVVEYELTPVGRSLLVPLRHMVDWANANFESIRASRDRYLTEAEAATTANAADSRD